MKIKIKEPYWGAWKKYGWAKKTWGVGFSVAKVNKAIKLGEKIEVNIWKFKTNYIVDPKKIKDFATSTDTIFEARQKTKLYVVPYMLLEEVKGGDKK